MLRLTEVVKHLLIINVLMFIASKTFIDLDLLALHYPTSDKFQPYQIVTHFFMHANLAHLFFNMFALWMFGSALEQYWGPKRFLFFYFFCAFGAALLHMGWNYYEFSGIEAGIAAFRANPGYDTYWAFFQETNLTGISLNQPYIDSLGQQVVDGQAAAIAEAERAMEQVLRLRVDVPIVGASGAVYGLLLAFGMYFPNVELMLIFLPIPIKAKYFIPILMAVELYLGVNQFSWDNIAHFAHLGGALSGLLLILYWRQVKGRH